MARRILYNPVEFVEASTPFYENIIGMITDQTDRISRNIEMAREENRIAEDRQWQEGMMDKQLGARRELAQEQMDHQSRESAIDRGQRLNEFTGSQILGYDRLALDWAKLMNDQGEAQRRVADKELQDAQSLLNKTDDIFRNAGFASSDFSIRRQILRHPQSGEMMVIDPFNKDENGNPTVIGNYEDYITRMNPVVNFIENVMGGQNATEWARSNLKFGEYTSPQDDVEYVDGHRFLDYVAEIQRQGPMSSSLGRLNDFTDMDSGVNLLFKEEHENFLGLGDQHDINYRVHSNIGTLTDANMFRSIFTEDMKRFSGDLRKFWSSAGTRENVMAVFPRPYDMELANLPGVTLEGQTVGQMANTWQNLRSRYSDETPDEIKRVGQAIEDFDRLAYDTLYHFGDEIIPDHLKNVPIYKLSRALRLNKDAVMSNHIDLKNIWKFPESVEQIEDMQDTVDRSNERSPMERVASGFKYGFDTIPLIYPGL